MKLIDAFRTIRKELIIKDEPLKAYKMLTYIDGREQKALSEEIKKTYGMVRHVYSPDEYMKAYDIPVPDAGQIEAEDIALNAGERYDRYRWILEELDKEKAKSLLDLGCYVGSVVLTAAKRGFTAYGVDMTRGSIDIANERARKFGLEKKAKFYLGDVRLFDKHEADIVMSFEVLEHIPVPGKYIRHMARLAKKWAYVSTPNGPFGNGEGNVKGGWEWRGEKDYRGHLRVFTEATLRDLIESCDCEIALLESRDDGLVHCKFRRIHGA